MGLRDLFRRLFPLPATRFDEGEPTLCHCACHETPGMMHAQPCCYRCPACGARLSAGLRQHRQSCSGDASG